MNLDLLTSGTTSNKPWAQMVFNTVDANVVNASDVETKTINHLPVYVPATFNGGSAGFAAPYVLGTALSGSTASNVSIALPASYWTYTDCKLTYGGPSGQAYFYGTGSGFVTDTLGTYVVSILKNGVPDPNNLNMTYVGAIGTLATIRIEGSSILNNGDYLQVSFDKGSDIVGAPVVNNFGMGFVLFRVG